MPRLKPAALPRDDDHEDASNRDGSFVQRVVPAAGAPKPETSAANSVFGQAAPAAVRGRKPGTVAQPIDVDAVEIRKGVPLPPSITGTGGVSASAALLAKMSKGDSVVLPGPQARTLVSTARKLGIKAQLRSMKHDAALVARHGEEVAGGLELQGDAVHVARQTATQVITPIAEAIASTGGASEVLVFYAGLLTHLALDVQYCIGSAEITAILQAAQSTVDKRVAGAPPSIFAPEAGGQPH